MDWQKLIFLSPYLISLAVAISLGLYTWRRRGVTGATTYTIIALAQASWTLGFILELLSPTIEAKIFWDDFQFGAGFLLLTGYAVFAAEYTGRLKHPRRTWVLLSIAPLISMGVIFTDQWHQLIRPVAWLEPRWPFPELLYEFTPAVLAISAYGYGLLLISVALLVNHLVRQQRLYRIQTVIIIVGILIPIVGTVFTLVGVTFGPYRDMFPITSAIANAVIAWGLFRHQLFDIIPVAWETVLESMSDLVAVLDVHDRVVDINPAMLTSIGRTAAQTIGQPAATVFARWPEVVEPYRLVAEARAEIATGAPEQLRHFDLRLSPLRDPRGRLTGRAVVLRDITERREAEAALRQSRDELEARVRERTAELSEANAALQSEIAERRRTEVELSRQLKETQALFQISQLLAGSLALQNILQTIVEAAAGVVERADRVVMHLLDASGTTLRPVAVAGPDRSGSGQRVNFRWGEGIAGLVIASGQAIYAADAPSDPRYIPLGNQAGRVHALLAAPVYAGEKRLGTLSVHSAEVGVFTPDDERLLTTLGAHAGLAIEKARLFEAERRRAQEAETLQQVTRTLINRRKLPELLQDAVEAIATTSRYKYVVVNLREKDQLTPCAWKGYKQDDLRLLSINEGITGRVARTGVPALVPDMRLDPDAVGVGLGAQSLIGVPLTHAGRLLGVLTVEAEADRPLDENDLNWLMSVGGQLSTAMENTRLYSDLENALQQEKAARAQLVQSEKLAAMGRLVASVAHELNNPIQAIQNALYLIRQESNLSEQTRADVDVVMTETRRMAELINRLRETYRPATSEQFKPVLLNAVVEDVRKLIHTHLRHSQIAFVFDPDQTLPPVRGMRDQLKQAILNLCLNAAEAMLDGGQLTVQTRGQPGSNEVALSITDTGVGIPPEDLANVFDPFFTTKDSGTGLGLAITHDIIERHGGRIEVTSEPGQGATFTVWLPVGESAIAPISPKPE